MRLLMLVNDVSLRNLIPNELAKGFGFFHGKPSTAFGPVAVKPSLDATRLSFDHFEPERPGRCAIRPQESPTDVR